MTPSDPSHRRRLLLYEPRVEGHHPTWLRYITEDLLSADYDLTLATDLRPASRAILEEHLGDIIERLRLSSALDEKGRRRGGSTLHSLQLCFAESGAESVFLCEFDELASSLLRRSALGSLPSRELRGRIGGIYYRPAFFPAPWWSPNRWLKALGFRRLVAGDWLRPLLLPDEGVFQHMKRNFSEAPFFFLPDPCPDDFSGDKSVARRRLEVPAERPIFLFFGVGSHRKGRHVAVDALLHLHGQDSFLLLAGKQNPGPAVRRGLESLTRQGRARVIDRYVTPEEERLCFQAADAVLLPYVGHRGSSGVLMRAMASGHPVIASDENFVGQLVRDHQLGLTFPTADDRRLAEAILKMERLEPDQAAFYRENIVRFARKHSRQAYRESLLTALSTA